MGGQGHDTLIGEQGEDYLRGGTGADVFVMATGHARDHVLDWEDGIDRVQLIGISSFAQVRTVQWGGDVHVQVSGETWIVLHGQKAADIGALDFIFG